VTAAPVGAGGTRFARFAWPPNHLGHCGPAPDGELWAYATGEPANGGLADLARGFEGAWPYLELLAGLAGVDDPLADEVVEAYWVGGGLLDRVDLSEWCWHLHDRFRHQLGGEWERLVAGAVAGGRPTHAFHVFCVYPWLGLLRSGVVDQPLHVMDRCRIRPGVVEAVVGSTAVVRVRSLVWEGGLLALGEPERQVVDVAAGGRSPVADLAPGDTVALHWDWVCERLGRRQERALRSETARHLRIANGLGAAR